MSDNKGDNSHDNAIAWGILAVIFAGLIWLFWYFFDTEVRNIVRWIRYAEMWLISWVVPADYTVPFQGKQIPWHAGFNYVPRWDMKELGYQHLSMINALAMEPLRPVFAGLLGLAAMWCVTYGPGTQFRKKLGIEGLIERQSINFPVIAPFIEFNPSDQPPRAPGSPVPAELPSFAEALGPEEWIAYHGIPIPDGKLDEEALARAFRKQLYGRWKGAKALEPSLQVLLASFCLKASRKRNESDVMLGRLAKCWSFKKGLQLKKDKNLVKEARRILSNKKLAESTLKITNQHAFVTTALLGALNHAREEGGVLAPASFVWLRGYNRTLWYPLNNLGRQAFHMEALGAMSHYKAERRTQRPIPVPKVEGAVETIVEYMASARARPVPQLDYSTSSKRGIKKAV